MRRPIVLLASLLSTTTASLIPDLLRSLEDLQDVQKRCANPCGYYGQVCCGSGEACYTDSNDQAQCTVAPQATQVATQNGVYSYWTTTYLQTDLQTITQTLSTLVPSETSSCKYSEGQTPCGNVCCLSGQYCQSSGQCVAVGGGSSGYYSNLYTVTTIITNTAVPPTRPTTNTLVTVTQTGTATGSFVTPSAASGTTIPGLVTGSETSSGGGLSGGAIAGIVIGVIAGVILLLLFCLCFCAKELLDGILGIFGFGGRRRRRTEVEEVYESRHHHDSRSGSRAGAGRTWFGTRPNRRDEKKKKSGIGAGWTTVAFLGGLAALLGLKRNRDKKHRDDKSSHTGYGSSYYSDYSSE